MSSLAKCDQVGKGRESAVEEGVEGWQVAGAQKVGDLMGERQGIRKVPTITNGR